MIVEERMRTFINSLDPGEPAWLDEIRSSALQDNVPIIRMEMGSLLRFLLTLRRPSSILEVGTAVGYSALFSLGTSSLGSYPCSCGNGHS